MHNFTYHRPKSLAEAIERLETSDDPKLLSGGMTLLPTMKQRLASPSDLIDISRLPELAGIAREGAALVIGAGVRHADVAASPIVADAIPSLGVLADLIGDPHVRHMGTLGGSIANNDPSADYPAACVALDATVTTSRRSMASEAFFTGMFETALEPTEIVVKVAFPIPQRAAYRKYRNPASGYAMVGVFVAKTDAGVRVAVTGAGACVFRVPEMESALGKDFSAHAIAHIVVDPTPLTSDLHGSAAYRADLVSVLARRAVSAAA